MEAASFSLPDWCVFATMLFISVLVGFYFNRVGQNTTQSFLMGGNNMKLIPTTVSLLVSFVSAISMLGQPAEMYRSGSMFYMSVIGSSLGALFTATVFVPLIYPLRILSVYEYLERRFDSKAAKLTGTILMIMQQVIYMGIASFAPSTALEAVTGFPTWATIIIISVVSTFYTFLGGMKAVIWTDFFQSFIMLAGTLAILIYGSVLVGGFDSVWEINEEWQRIEFFDFNTDPTQRHSFWSLVIGGMVTWVASFGLNQSCVQRFCAMGTMVRARASLLLNIVGILAVVTLNCLAGIVIFAFYAKKGCDPYSNKDVSNSNQIVPYFVMENLAYPGLPGLFISSLFSGALSTMSSSLNALAAVTWEDLLKPFLGNKTESQKAWITRALVVFYGMAGVGVSFFTMTLTGTVVQVTISFMGAVSGPLLGLFVLGAFFPWANWKGAVVGSICGLALPLWIGLGAYSVEGTTGGLAFPTSNCSNISNVSIATMTTVTIQNATVTSSITGVKKLYTLSYMWHTTLGVLPVVIVGLIVSFITGPTNPADVDTKYLIPIVNKILRCFPGSCRPARRCNLIYKSPKEIMTKGNIMVKGSLKNHELQPMIPEENETIQASESKLIIGSDKSN